MSFPLQSAKAAIPPGIRSVVKAAVRRSGRQPGYVGQALAALLREVKIAAISRRALRSLRLLARRRDLSVHLGCGSDIRSGWVNIDMSLAAGSSVAGVPEQAEYINYDLRLGLPLAEGSCALIYSSHFFEHLTSAEGARLMRHCYRALQPGGRFRIVLPSFKGAFRAYLAGDESYFDLAAPLHAPAKGEGDVQTILDHVAYCVYQFGEHKCLYDEEKVQALLLAAGFRSASVSEFDPDIDIDSPLRRRYSFYVEAVK